ncbi:MULTISPECIES: hypothetical protein [Mycobacteriaceae]|uniref:hypothetical protein n=1 Tax=Mycobacteriaceae TaxID=1762 RepID=UPI0018D434B1|nr:MULTISPECIES: hypothetical protein [Mycobacteriaceae]MCK0177534.1 hypothetical protein [Mycolicibacterium sp. F2034L]
MAVRFTGSSVAGLGFVTATYTLSVSHDPVGTRESLTWAGMGTTENIGCVEYWRYL